MPGGKVSHPVRPGGLSSDDHVRIDELAARGWSAMRIAQTIEKHTSTVQLRMYRQGWKACAPNRDLKPRRRRDGTIVRPFSPAEDAFIEALRANGMSSTKIAAALLDRFGHRRTAATICIRLHMLAAREVAA